MNSRNLIDSLERFQTALPAVVYGLSAEDSRWKPADGAWSILETVAHLIDEELYDFRTRLRLTLEDPDQRWPGINPPQWAIDHRYNAGNLNEAVEKFIVARTESVRWLRSLGNVDWSTTHHHAQIGAIRAGDLLTAWAAHDALHLRQIAKRMHQLAQRDGGEFSAQYAGEWTS